MSARQWPQASLDPVGRARALAAAMPASASVEGVLDAPYDVVWPWVADLQHSVPQFDTQVSKVVVRRRAADPEDAGAEHLNITAYSMGIPLGFDVRLEDGYCLMRATARLYLVMMAAVPEDGGERTRFLHLEAIPLPGTRILRRHLQKVVNADFRNLSRLAANGFGPTPAR